MRLYNSLTRCIEDFTPAHSPVTVYVCGITPYDTTHLGHAFTYTSFDILVRYLESLGRTVRFAENVTDIDDDILRKAREVGEDWQTLGNQWTAHFIRDMEALNVRPPDYYPRATDVIPDIVATVERLLDEGVAYTADGSVFFDVTRWPEYGELSCLPRDEMLPVANERGNNPDDPRKRHPLDFVLWQAQAPGEPAWDSPWGPGRPGWHIECSTMVHRFLGEQIDIHGGGADLIFPHHESEIAQAESASGREPFVRIWMHTAMVGHEGEKMSKSLGNLVMVRDLLKTWPPDVLRVYLGSHHYRDAWSYNQDELPGAQETADRIRGAVAVEAGTRPTLLRPPAAVQAFQEAMDDDLATPQALRVLDGLAEETLAAARAGEDVRETQQAIRRLAGTLGLMLDAAGPEERVIAGWDRHLKRFRDGLGR